MEFEISRSYVITGNAVFINYPQLEKYPHRVVEVVGEEFETAYITIKSLEELLQLQKEIKQSLILDIDGELVIYDGCIE